MPFDDVGRELRGAVSGHARVSGPPAHHWVRAISGPTSAALALGAEHARGAVKADGGRDRHRRRRASGRACA